MKTLPRDLTIEEAIERIRHGQLTSRLLVESCLQRIEQREDEIQAWAQVYEREALEMADACDASIRDGRWLGELHGIPIGVKDIIDVEGMWLRAGCEAYPARVSRDDAAVVRKLKHAGAVILGKTRTTPFANSDPAITKNPWNPDHTPGGSSSGSAAAVADRMCLAALGSQTGGSVIRPASYNGVVGFKPTFSMLSLDGVIPVSWHLDHIGSHTRCVADGVRLFHVMREERPNPLLRMPHPMANRSPRSFSSSQAPRLGFFRNILKHEVTQEMMEHIAALRETFASAGATILDIDMPDSFEDVHSAHNIIFEVDLACYHRELFASRADLYPPKLKSRIERGLDIEGHRYAKALRTRKTFQDDVTKLLSSVDAGCMMSSLSTAPFGLASTGSSAANAPWSFAGFPAISLPSGLDSQGLPFGAQLVGPAWSDEATASVAGWCENVLDFAFRPPVSPA